MKKTAAAGIVLLIAISPLFKGLFFHLEMYIFFAIISTLSAVYLITKVLKNQQPVFSKTMIALNSALVLAYILSFTGAVDYRENIDTVVRYSIYFISSLVLFDYFKDNTARIKGIFSVSIVCAGTLASVIGLAGYSRAFPLLKDTIFSERIGTAFQYTNTAAAYLLVCIILVVSLVINSKNILIRVLLSGAGNLIMMALFFTGSRGVFAIFPVIIIVFIIIMPKGYRLNNAISTSIIALPIFLAVKHFETNIKITGYLSAAKWLFFSVGVSMLLALAFGLLIRLNAGRKVMYAGKALFIVVIISVLAILLFIFQPRFTRVFTDTIPDSHADGTTNVQPIGNGHTLAGKITSILPQDILKRLLTINLKEANFVARVQMDQDAFKLIKSNWLYGLGGGGWPALYQSVQSYFYTARAVHNHYLQVFVESGILGFTAFTCLALIIFICLSSFVRRNGAVCDKISAAGFLCAFITLCIHSAIDFDLTYSSMALLWWAISAAAFAYYCNLKNNPTAKPVKSAKPAKLDKNVKAHQLVKPYKYINIQTGIKTTYIIHKAAYSIMTAVCIFLGGICSVYAYGAYYENKGLEAAEQVDIIKAISFYEKAAGIDVNNAGYKAAFADLCLNISTKCDNVKDKANWLNKAIAASEDSVRLSPEYPYYISVLTRIYLDAGYSIKACKAAQKLVAVQPRKNSNYELLARSYTDAAIQYLKLTGGEKGEAVSELGNSAAGGANGEVASGAKSSAAGEANGEVASGAKSGAAGEVKDGALSDAKNGVTSKVKNVAAVNIKNIENAIDLLKKCSEIDDIKDITISPVAFFYVGKSLLLLGEYKQAEERLKKARQGSLSVKFDSDRLLYIINEETGRSKENDKYRSSLWMGRVEQTPLYKEVKMIISEKMLW